MDITEILAEHWLSIAAAVFLMCMVLYDHYRGFLRVAVTMSALIISLIFGRMAAPKVTTYLRENTTIQTMIQESLIKAAGAEKIVDNAEGFGQLPAVQRTVIENLHLPKQMKEALLENNNREIYQILGVSTFFEYIGAYLSNMILNLIGSVLVFILSYLGLRFLMNVMDIFAKLPIINGMNQIAGAVLGLIRGLLWIWGFFLVVDLFSSRFWAQLVLAQIHGSIWLSFLYHNNVFNWLFTSMLKGFL